MYRMVHTIGKTNSGGVSDGLFKNEKISILSFVKKAEIPPTNKGSKIHKINFFQDIFIKSSYNKPIFFFCIYSSKNKKEKLETQG